MPVAVELRERIYHIFCANSPKPVHGHSTEFLAEAASIVANAMFVGGSVMFFNSSTMVFGAELFLVGSCIFVLLSGVNVYEQRAYDSFSEGTLAEKILPSASVRQRRAPGTSNERFLENLCYCVASLVFAIASVFYIHRFRDLVEDEEIGSWMFVAGSLGFALASFFNALGIHRDDESGLPPDVALRAYNLATLALACTQLGSICFVTGSYLYRPALETDCAHRDDDAVCISTLDQGTWLYVIGSCLYLAQSCLNLFSVVLKTRAVQEAAAEKQGP